MDASYELSILREVNAALERSNKTLKAERDEIATRIKLMQSTIRAAALTIRDGGNGAICDTLWMCDDVGTTVFEALAAELDEEISADPGPDARYGDTTDNESLLRAENEKLRARVVALERHQRASISAIGNGIEEHMRLATRLAEAERLLRTVRDELAAAYDTADYDDEENIVDVVDALLSTPAASSEAEESRVPESLSGANVSAGVTGRERPAQAAQAEKACELRCMCDACLDGGCECKRFDSGRVKEVES